jgi:hypothetical protein
MAKLRSSREKSTTAGCSTAQLIDCRLHGGTQRQRATGRRQASPCRHEQRIGEGLAQARQAPAHRGRTQMQAARGAGHAAFLQQDVQVDQQVQVEGVMGHG